MLYKFSSKISKTGKSVLYFAVQNILSPLRYKLSLLQIRLHRLVNFLLPLCFLFSLKFTASEELARQVLIPCTSTTQNYKKEHVIPPRPPLPPDDGPRPRPPPPPPKHETSKHIVTTASSASNINTADVLLYDKITMHHQHHICCKCKYYSTV